MKVDGACHCGAIRYEAVLDPEMIGICHCSDCQALSASAYRTIAVVDAKHFKLTRGVPKLYIKTGDSGNRRIQAFCASCGSGLFATSADDSPKHYNIRTGTLRQRDEIVPAFECWRQSALHWLPIYEHTKKFDQNPTLG